MRGLVISLTTRRVPIGLRRSSMNCFCGAFSLESRDDPSLLVNPVSLVSERSIVCALNTNTISSRDPPPPSPLVAAARRRPARSTAMSSPCTKKIVVIIFPGLESPIFRRSLFRTADGAKHPSVFDEEASSNLSDLKSRKIMDLRLGSRTSSRTRSVGWTPAARVERGIHGGWISG